MPLREYRWQLIAVLVTALTFVAVLFLDSDSTPTPTVTIPAPTQAITPIEPTGSPTATEESVLPVTTLEDSASQPFSEPASDLVITYREALVGQVGRLNPLFASLNPAEQDITTLIFEGLTTINQYGEIVPALADDWAVSSDGYTYVFTLRQDVLWHDGERFTANDVVYTLSLLQSADFPGEAALMRFWRTVEIQQVDEFTVRFRLAQPLASFPEALRIGVLPEHALRGTNAAQLAAHPFNLTPIGTGPYQLEALRVDGATIRVVDLRVAPNFRLRAGGESGYAVERMRFRLYDTLEDALAALKAGEVDGYAVRSRQERDALQSASNVELLQTFAPSVGMLIFNWANESVSYFNEERVRVALALGLNRSSLVERNLYNQAVRADSPLMRLSWAYDYGDSLGASWMYDPDRARQEMSLVAQRLQREEDETSTEEPSAITPGDAVLSFTVMVLDDPALVNIVNEIAAQWALIGVTVTVEAVDKETYLARLTASDFEAALVELSKEGSADPDVYSFWHQGQYPDGKNYGGANSTVISQALERARRETNGLHRMLFYDEFQREFIERAVAIPLYYPLFTYAISTRVEGVQIGFISIAADRFVTLRDWVIIPD